MKQYRTPTGHRDCCGEMICEGDHVVTRHGESVVIAVEKSWRLHYEDGHLEPLNCYDACRLRRVSEAWDNGRDNGMGQDLLSRDKEMIVPQIVP